MAGDEADATPAKKKKLEGGASSSKKESAPNRDQLTQMLQGLRQKAGDSDEKDLMFEGDEDDSDEAASED